MLEALEQPLSLTLAIMDLRSYAAAWRAVDQNIPNLPPSPYIDLVFEMQKRSIANG